MQVLYPNWVVVCDDDISIIEKGVVVFDKTIQFVGELYDAKELYPDLEINYLGDNSIVMPGLINSHIHLEFSANKTTLNYGNFISWLFSVIQNREELASKATKELIDNELNNMLQSGTTTIGAISSYGSDLNSCIATPLNVVYFVESLGSKPDMIDTLFADFKAKLQIAMKNKKENFIPAIAIHSPYSTHPFLIREVLKIAKEKNLSVSAHFLESKQEKQWLENSTGEFKKFFNNLLNQTKSITTADDFLEQFKDIKKLSFTHCIEADKTQLNKIKQLNGSINHCPKSNRLLTNSSLNLKECEDINISLGTDGLSSNNSLNMFDELRDALFIHTDYELNSLASKLLKMATNGGAKALGLKKGILKKDYDADIICFDLPNKTEKENLFTSIILHTTKVNQVYIGGRCEFSI